MLAQKLVSIVVGLPTVEVTHPAARSVECGPYLGQQRLGPEGLQEKGCGARLEASLPRSLVALRRQNHDGDVVACCPELMQEVEAAHPAHPEIED
jgi:hypothetical protein